MTPTPGGLPDELSQRYRTATKFVVGFLILDALLLVLAFFIAEKIFRPRDPVLIMGLRIAIVVFGVGAIVLRRTRFRAMRLKDIAALKGMSGLLRTLEGTTIQIACIGGAIALMGFMITILTGDWTEMLRAAGIAAIVLIYGHRFRSSWERVARQLADYSQPS